MKKLLSILLTPLFVLAFILLLVIFHPILVFYHRVLGHSKLQKAVDGLNYALMRSLLIMGCYPKVEDQNTYDYNRPLVVVANHQSMHDIPPLVWHYRKFGMRFVAKKELEKGVPCVSYNLRHGENITINRKDRKQALQALKDGAEALRINNRAICIFPEGTRSRDGHPKKFNPLGLKILLDAMPEAQVVPVTINGSWKLMKNGLFPIPFGVKTQWKVHPVVDRKGKSFSQIFTELESAIKRDIWENKKAT